MTGTVRLRTPLEPAYVIEAVAQFRGLGAEELINGSARSRAIAGPRHEVCYLVRELCQMSYAAAARFLGGCDSTTVLNGCNVVAGKVAADEGYAEQLQRIGKLAGELQAVAQAGSGIGSAQMVARRVLTHGAGASPDEIEAVAVQLLAIASILDSTALTAVEARAAALVMLGAPPVRRVHHG